MPREILDRVESILSLHMSMLFSWSAKPGCGLMLELMIPSPWALADSQDSREFQSLGKTDLKGTFETCAHDLVN